MSTVIGTVVGAAGCLAASPYLARLTLTVPDREERRWWRGAPIEAGRLALTAAVALALGALAGAAAGWTALLPAFVWLALVSAPLVVIDFEHHRLPNRLVVTAAVGAGAFGLLAAGVRDDWHALLHGVEGAVAVFLVLFLLAFIAPNSFGYGDVKLGAVLGGYLGWFGWLDVYYGIFGGFLIGAVVGVVLMATRRASLKTALAFGPMLVLGTLIVLAFDLAPNLG
ncbi:MAG TPA: A24 family peptidase [Jatrophihabitantaceae bacterium]|nr:A24 family peptidase [Jatrophihabitantaceae bacterium]